MQWNEYEGLNGSSKCQLGYLERIKLYFKVKKNVILGARWKRFTFRDPEQAGPVDDDE